MNSDQQGFTLLEALVSLAILSIGLIAIVRSFSTSIQAGGYTQELTTAYFLAQDKIAELETIPQTILGTKTGDFGQDYPDYRWQTIVASTSDESIQEAVVTIFWERKSKEGQVELLTLLQQRALTEGTE